MKNKIIIGGLVVAFAGLGAFSAGSTLANSANGQDSLIQKIADKFHLKKDDVQAVFNQDRQERKTQMQQNFNSKLDQAVKDGKINETQKAAIIKKFDELRNNKENDFKNFRSMTPDQRKQVMDKQKTDLQAWAKDNNIDLNVLQEILGPGKGYGMMGNHGGGMRMMRQYETPSQ